MTMDRLISKCLFYVGKDVLIEWDDPDDDWPSFRVLEVDTERHGITLQGIDSPDGKRHEGDIFEMPIADIRIIKPYERE